MRNPASPGGAAPARLLLVAVAMVVLAGCEFATGTVRTVTELQEAGIRNPNLQFNDDVATLEYDSSTGPLDRAAEQDRAAEVIWKNLPFQVERISIRARGDGILDIERSYSRPALEELFGPRPSRLDRSPADAVRRAVVIAGIGGLVVLAAVVLIIVLVVRAVRNRPAVQPAGGQAPPPWSQPGYGQQPSQGWPQQPPQGWPQQPPQGWPQQPPQGWPQQPAQPPQGRPQQPPQGWPQQPAQPPPRPPDDWPLGAPEPGGGQPPPEEPPPRDRGPTPPG
jgi:hypothetical protein